MLLDERGSLCEYHPSECSRSCDAPLKPHVRVNVRWREREEEKEGVGRIQGKVAGGRNNTYDEMHRHTIPLSRHLTTTTLIVQVPKTFT